MLFYVTLRFVIHNIYIYNSIYIIYIYIYYCFFRWVPQTQRCSSSQNDRTTTCFKRQTNPRRTPCFARSTVLGRTWSWRTPSRWCFQQALGSSGGPKRRDSEVSKVDHKSSQVMDDHILGIHRNHHKTNWCLFWFYFTSSRNMPSSPSSCRVTRFMQQKYLLDLGLMYKTGHAKIHCFPIQTLWF